MSLLENDNTLKLYQPNYDNGETWEDADSWVSDTVYLTEEQAIEEIKSLGYEDLGEYRSALNKVFTFDNTGKSYGREDYGYAYVEVLTLGGDTDGVILPGQND